MNDLDACSEDIKQMLNFFPIVALMFSEINSCRSYNNRDASRPEAGNTEAGIVNNALAIPMRSKDKKTNNDEKWTKMILYDIFSDKIITKA